MLGNESQLCGVYHILTHHYTLLRRTVDSLWYESMTFLTCTCECVSARLTHNGGEKLISGLTLVETFPLILLHLTPSSVPQVSNITCPDKELSLRAAFISLVAPLSSFPSFPLLANANANALQQGDKWPY